MSLDLSNHLGLRILHFCNQCTLREHSLVCLDGAIHHAVGANKVNPFNMTFGKSDLHIVYEKANRSNSR